MVEHHHTFTEANQTDWTSERALKVLEEKTEVCEGSMIITV